MQRLLSARWVLDGVGLLILHVVTRRRNLAHGLPSPWLSRSLTSRNPGVLFIYAAQGRGGRAFRERGSCGR